MPISRRHYVHYATLRLTTLFQRFVAELIVFADADADYIIPVMPTPRYAAAVNYFCRHDVICHYASIAMKTYTLY